MKIGFIGAGNMGEAYISALSNEEIYIYEVNADRREYMAKEYGVKISEYVANLIENSDYIVLAIKPQFADEVLKDIKKAISVKKIDMKKKTFISIMAGKPIEYFEKALGEDVKLVRVMPNTPAQIKKGISGVCFNSNIEEKENILKIIDSTGKSVIVEEKMIDVLTAISGSGPAFVFMLINSFAEGGVKLGMTKQMALELAIETFIGSAELIKQTGKHPEVLKDMVASPGGTTAAGLFKMEENGIRKAMIETVEATYNRAKELAK